MARAAFVVDRADGPDRARGARLRGAALVLRVRGAGHHGDAHDPLAAPPPGHDPGRAADDLLGAAAGLRAADRRVRAGDARWRASSASRASCCSASTCSARARRSLVASVLVAHASGAATRSRSTWSCRPTASRRCACSLRRCGAPRAPSCAARARSSSPSRSCSGCCSRSRARRRRAGRAARRGRARTRSSTAPRGASATRSSRPIAPLGFDWKIGVGLVASLAAREVIVATLAQIYAASDDDDGLAARRHPRRRRPAHGPARLHAGHRRLAARLLRVRAPVHVDARDRCGARPTRGAGRPSPSATFWRSPTARASSPIGSSVRSRANPLPLLLGAALLASAGCGTRYARVPVHSDELAHGGAARGAARRRAARPRLRASGHDLRRPPRAHARADRRADGRGRRRGERAQAGDPDRAGLSARRPALARRSRKADSSQEVVVQALRSERRLGLFTQTFATSFVAFVGSDDLLHLQLSRLDWPVPKGERGGAARARAGARGDGLPRAGLRERGADRPPVGGGALARRALPQPDHRARRAGRQGHAAARC